MIYIIKSRTNRNGTEKVERVNGLVFYDLKDAQKCADSMNGTAPKNVTYWPEECAEWTKKPR